MALTDEEFKEHKYSKVDGTKYKCEGIDIFR